MKKILQPNKNILSAKKHIKSIIIETKPIEWNKLVFLQSDDFKDLSPEDKLKLRSSLLLNGFADPFTVWLDESDNTMYCLDGKHRSNELFDLINDGFDVPKLLPATFIRCKDKQEAAALVLTYSSYYAKISSYGLFDFLEQYQIDIDSISSGLNIPDINLKELTTLPDYSDINKELSIADYDDTMEMKFNFSKDDFIKVNQRLKEIAVSDKLNSKERVILNLLSIND